MLAQGGTEKMARVSRVLLAGYVITLLLPLATINHLFAILLLLPWLATSGGWILDVKEFALGAKYRVYQGFFLLFLLSAISFFYSANKEDALSALAVRLPFLLFPLVFSTSNISEKHLHFLLRLFVYLCALVCLGCLLFRVYTFLYGNQDANYFYNEGLISITKKRVVFFGGYVSFSIFICGYFLLKDAVTRLEKILLAVVAVFLFLILFLLAVRMVLLITLAVGMATVFIKLMQRRRYVLAGTGVAMMVLAFVALLQLFPQTKSRFQSIGNLKYSFANQNKLDHFNAANQAENWNGLTLRMAKWRCALDVIEQNPLIGVGVGDVKDEIVQAYQNRGFLYAVQNRFDPHNQFLEITMATGIMGLLVFVWLLYHSLHLFWRTQNWMAMAFMVLLLFSSMTESLLRTQEGVAFYIFFWCLFVAYSLSKETVPLKKLVYENN
ncbi:O-antigen ligase family protein [Nibribacter koreensis]|uniref:O-antigen ligase-related domain-containing protein n=1 Tax=Nibribacter koreensis TaxID=1084519 RepID=A0ABP8FAQ6_9BACT